MKRGYFISIEGTEGAGKSTTISAVAHCLKEAKIDFVITREPGGTDLAESIRQILLSSSPSSEKIQPITELLLMFAGRAQHLHYVIEPALSNGKWVISDRFIDASYAYQGGGRGIDTLEIELLDKWVVGECYPVLTVLLDLPPDTGLQRAEKRGVEKDRIEQEKLDFFNRVRAVYLKRAHDDPMRIKVVDASLDEQAVQMRVLQWINELIEAVKK